MAVHDVLARRRERDGARDQVDVDPGVDADAGGLGGVDDGRQRIEAGRLARQVCRKWLQPVTVVSVAAAPHLHEQRVESVLARLPNQGRNSLG